MMIERRLYDDSIIWVLASGWRVSPESSLDFTAPDGVIYDRCSWLLIGRCDGRFPKHVQLTDIFTDEEFEQYKACFDCKEVS